MAELAGLVQRLRRLVQTEADRFMNLNALSSQAAARGGSHYNNAIGKNVVSPHFSHFADDIGGSKTKASKIARR